MSGVSEERGCMDGRVAYSTPSAVDGSHTDKQLTHAGKVPELLRLTLSTPEIALCNTQYTSPL